MEHWQVTELEHRYMKALELLFAISREVLAFQHCHNLSGSRIRHDNAEGIARQSFKLFGTEAERMGVLETPIPF